MRSHDGVQRHLLCCAGDWTTRHSAAFARPRCRRPRPPRAGHGDAERPRFRATHAATAYREPPIGLVAVAAGIRAAGNGAAGAVPQAAGRPALAADARPGAARRSEEHTSELQSLMPITYAVFCLTQNNTYHYS